MLGARDAIWGAGESAGMPVVVLTDDLGAASWRGWFPALGAQSWAWDCRRSGVRSCRGSAKEGLPTTHGV